MNQRAQKKIAPLKRQIADLSSQLGDLPSMTEITEFRQTNEILTRQVDDRIKLDQTESLIRDVQGLRRMLDEMKLGSSTEFYTNTINALQSQIAAQKSLDRTAELADENQRFRQRSRF